MTDREASLYRWLETFTLDPAEDRGNPLYELSLYRKYIARVPLTGQLTVTQAGWDWFAIRSSQIIARCNAGFHEMRAKTPYCVGLHCTWCGCPDAVNCRECVTFFLSGTIEGGWSEPLEVPAESVQRSTISHGRE